MNRFLRIVTAFVILTFSAVCFLFGCVGTKNKTNGSENVEMSIVNFKSVTKPIFKISRAE